MCSFLLALTLVSIIRVEARHVRALELVFYDDEGEIDYTDCTICWAQGRCEVIACEPPMPE